MVKFIGFLGERIRVLRQKVHVKIIFSFKNILVFSCKRSSEPPRPPPPPPSIKKCTHFFLLLWIKKINLQKKKNYIPSRGAGHPSLRCLAEAQGIVLT